MKALKYFSYLILLLFVVFVLIGQFFGNLVYTSKITINQPVEKCWNVLVDREQMENWVKNFRSIELLNEAPSTKQYKLVVVDGGEEYEIVETFLRSVPHESYAIEWENDVSINNIEYHFFGNSNGTIIEVTEKLQGKGLLMKPIFVFMKGYLQSETQFSLEQLKAFIESS